MALGTLGSTLNDELNRLANGGTYRDMNQMVDEALAAKQWANRENINPYSTDTVGILNEIAGRGLDKKNWLDFNGVCNYIAGTTGLPAAAALRQVYPTTDLLTGVASYYVDATAPTNWGSLGYVALPGIAGNTLQYTMRGASDSLLITGNLDFRLQLALDNWQPASESQISGTYQASPATAGYTMSIFNSGNFRFYFYDNNTLRTITSTAANTFTAGQIGWVRVTLTVNNGAGTPQYEVRFFTSTDGTNWTQLGTTVTGATGAATLTPGNGSGQSFFIGGTPVFSSTYTAGRYYRAQILNGIGGTTVLDVNIATDYRSSNQSFFTATTGQTVTVNGVDTIANLGAAGSLLPTTLGSSTAADSNDPKFLDFTGTNYVYLPGVASNHISVLDSSALRITGDIDLRAFIAMDDWTPAAATDVLMKWETTAQRAYLLRVETTGRLSLIFTTDGATSITVTSTASPTISDGSPLWVRATRVASTGVCQFFTSSNGTTWTQLGTDVTGTSGNIFSGTSDVSIGRSTGTLAGKVFRAQIFSDITGTNKVLDVDTSVITAGSATSFTAVTGQTVTINRSTSGRKTVAVTQPTWLFGTDDYMEVNNRYMSSGTYLYLPGVNSNNATAPDSAALDITGDIDVRVKVAADDWTPAAVSTFASKWQVTGNQRSWRFNLNTNGGLFAEWSPDGTNVLSHFIGSIGITDGGTKWVRWTLDVDNGASGNDSKFFTSDDGTTWTQVGTTQTTAGVTSIYNSTAALEIGSIGSQVTLRGKFFRAQVLNGINGTVAFDANFETSITSLLQTSFTESSANAATVTINRSGSAYRSAGITAAGYLYPGATNTFAASATDFLNFGASDSFTVLGVIRRPSFSGDYGAVISKSNGNDFPGYQIRKPFGTSATLASYLGGASSYVNSGNVTSTAGQLETIMMRVNRTAQTITTNLNGTDSTSISISSIGSVLNIIDTLKIGRTSVNSFYIDMEFYAGAVFRQTLTAAQIRQISNYFANREVYL